MYVFFRATTMLDFVPKKLHSPKALVLYFHLKKIAEETFGVRFTSVEGMKNSLDTFLVSKVEQFYWRGIHALGNIFNKAHCIYQFYTIMFQNRGKIL